ncbi:MAG: hypothetical protein MUP90_01570, partial [Gammaproteobacteria bacterium]|nr:hypothetical protein [Gammaproteobacteria bacterium]
MNISVCNPRRFFILAVAGVSATLAAPLATAASDDVTEVEEVVVTGSRIGRASDFESPSPVTTVSRDYIENS